MLRHFRWFDCFLVSWYCGIGYIWEEDEEEDGESGDEDRSFRLNKDGDQMVGWCGVNFMTYHLLLRNTLYVVYIGKSW